MVEERKYWDPEVETMPLGELEKIQEQRLREVVPRAYEKSTFYRRKYDEAGVKPSDIRSLGDLKKLPLVLDAEYRSAPIEERLAIPISEFKVVCSSSGTTGLPDILPRDEKDWLDCRYRIARAAWSKGIRPSDIVQVLAGFECLRMGYEKMGAKTLLIHAGRGILDNQIRLAKAMNVTIIEHLPSLVLNYLDRARQMGIEFKGIKVSGIGEGFARSYEKKIEKEYDITFLPRSFGATELRVSASECEERNGMHIFAERCIIEVVDPDTGELLDAGQEGELVATSLTVDSVPIIRWRTGDIASLLPYEPCPCGRTHPQISSLIRGRLAHVTNVTGKRIFPADVEEVVGSHPYLGNEFQIIHDKPGVQEKLKVKVEYSPEAKDLTVLKKQAEEALNTSLGIDSEVELVSPGSIGRTIFKAQRVIKSFEEG